MDNSKLYAPHVQGFDDAAEFMAQMNPHYADNPDRNPPSAKTIGRWIKDGLLRATRLDNARGKPYTFREADLIAFAPPTRGWVKGRPRK